MTRLGVRNSCIYLRACDVRLYLSYARREYGARISTADDTSCRWNMEQGEFVQSQIIFTLLQSALFSKVWHTTFMASWC